MKRVAGGWLGLLLVLSIRNAPRAEEPASPSAVAIPATARFDLTSKAGLVYRVFVAVPDGEAPAGGFPVIYALDGNAVFGTLVDASRMQRRLIGPAIIVGVGYPTDSHLDTPRRYLDFTPPTPEDRVRALPGGGPPPKTGGRDAFLAFLEDELKPRIERDYKVDRSRQTLIGHSLGGLFTLHVLFTRPAAFQTYVAASPSIWWDDRSIEAEEREFAKTWRGSSGTALLVTFGGLEESAVPGEPAERSEARKKNRMSGNAREMVDRLGALADRGLRVDVREFEGENHGSVVPAALSRALQFALTPPDR